MSTEDTARAILEYHDVTFPVIDLTVAIQNGIEDDGNHGEMICDFIDLQSMARLWLLLPEIWDLLARLEDHDKTETWLYNLSLELSPKLTDESLRGKL